MAGMLEQLLDILGEQATRYEELLGLSKEKKDVIIANDIEQLQKINHLENLVISQNQKLEKKRQSIVEDMAIVLDQKESDLTLPKMIELLEGQEGHQALIDLQKRFKEVVDELKEVNKQNGELIQNALEYIEFSTNVIRSTMNQGPATYAPGAEDNYPGEPGYIDTRN